LGYNSNVNAASRSLNINKFGLSPGISYFHRSGAYADVSAYWSQEYDPSVYLWIASAGYMRSITQYWTILGEYAHYFYSYSDTSPIRYYDPATMSYISYTPNTPYTNNLQVSNFLDAGKFTFRLDYSLLFGQQTVHRLAPSAGLNLSWKKVLGLDRIAIFPTVSLMYGSEVLPEKTEVTVEPITTRPLEIIFRYRNGLPLFTRQFTFTPERTVWGVMNYAINVPLSLSLRKWTVLVGYTYNFPQILPGEDLALSHGGFLSFNITRYLEFRRSR
jgi:hypothetical protein